MGSKVTAADVARVAGVSPATVDRVLNARGGVAKDKEARVLAAARQLRLDRALDLRAARTLRVAAFLQPPENPFHAVLAQAFADQNKGPNPYNLQTKVYYVGPDESPAKTISKIAPNYDAVIVSQPQEAALAGTLEKLAAEGTPVITLATRILAKGVSHVGPDDYRTGRVAGELVGRCLGRAGGTILAIAGHMSMAGQAARYQGFRDVIAERFPGCNLLPLRESRDSGSRAAALVGDTLAAHPDLAAIYNASAGTMPIADLLKRQGLAGQVMFFTHELTSERRALLANGVLDAVLDQDPVKEVAIALHVVADAFGRSPLKVESTEPPVRIYFRESL
ncbi:LacI family DNA-binding transcriptional regulator [Donghicola tyrosinivorans]|uniref:LacI family transcriptional regulator n=1 Tax=Donghicola tyrosinivorans TaxID=1652492 RepID=A0A2T0WL34_9RHOB|nr:LacI family DNA-binding transcriptional regulator [Donghicola tyrosinivorans]PRY87372.1 LacI family transcriptional regulator [Donghicola tyrosinivorans]